MSDSRLGTPEETHVTRVGAPSGDTRVGRLAPRHRDIGFRDLRRAARLADVDVVMVLRAALGIRIPADLDQRVADALRAVGVEPITDANNPQTEPIR